MGGYGKAMDIERMTKNPNPGFLVGNGGRAGGQGQG